MDSHGLKIAADWEGGEGQSPSLRLRISDRVKDKRKYRNGKDDRPLLI
ncbi:MAG: hypothetical protein AAGD25_13060 [Cyanobacteria bacterium P01_F01_bin.150]